MNLLESVVKFAYFVIASRDKRRGDLGSSKVSGFTPCGARRLGNIITASSLTLLATTGRANIFLKKGEGDFLFLHRFNQAGALNQRKSFEGTESSGFK